ncbi:Tetratricopeptide repeat-domain-containing protein [Pseudoneurospora amorphoporcata]|uniref:Tetratricopeptide repeat-domain-containing protein n=1 Tax=Pseudoneurospora amorphoporcata TaxID=241081 RepID=A0AAN6S9Z8_9PEZI|nr:Tetratricopeptide repeat-domain-containing protein [Pseudoneurospora amorphoporcata]
MDDDAQRLLRLLGGLPLALAQAAAYMGELNLHVASYIRLYEQQWDELFRNTDSGPLDYGTRSVRTTWTISFNAIETRDKTARNLLWLWAFLDNREMWHSLLQVARNDQEQWPKWLLDIAFNEVRFFNIATLVTRAGFWAWNSTGGECNIEDITIGHATHSLGDLYSDQGQLKEAETMYQRALKGYEKALGPDHTSTPDTVHNLSTLYETQGRLKEAEAIYQRALSGYSAALGSSHAKSLLVIENIASLQLAKGSLSL